MNSGTSFLSCLYYRQYQRKLLMYRVVNNNCNFHVVKDFVIIKFQVHSEHVSDHTTNIGEETFF